MPKLAQITNEGFSLIKTTKGGGLKCKRNLSKNF